MKKCNECGKTWVSMADWCIHCNSKDFRELSDDEAPWTWLPKEELEKRRTKLGI